MSTIRSALETTLLGLSYDGQSAKTFDFGSSDAAIAKFEQAVFPDSVGIFIGDSVSVQEPHSHAWRKVITEFEILLAERRVGQLSHFETYVEDMSEALPPSNLGGAVGNILSVEVTDVSQIEQTPEGNTWYMPVTVTVTHLQPVVIGSDFRINVDLPSCSIVDDSIEQWAQENASTISLSFNVSRGTGELQTLYVTCIALEQGEEYSATKSFGYVYEVQPEDETIQLWSIDTIGFVSGDQLTVYAVLTDSLGACAVATPVTAIVQ